MLDVGMVVDHEFTVSCYEIFDKLVRLDVGLYKFLLENSQLWVLLVRLVFVDPFFHPTTIRLICQTGWLGQTIT